MGMANRSSAVWRYFNIGATDESKAICVKKQYLVVDKKKGRRPRLSHAKLRTSLLGYQLLATYDRLSLVPRPPLFFVLGV